MCVREKLVSDIDCIHLDAHAVFVMFRPQYLFHIIVLNVMYDLIL